MVICVPPVTLLKISGNKNGSKAYKTQPVIVEDAGGIRFDKLIAGLKDWIAKDYRDYTRERWNCREIYGHTRWTLFDVIYNSSPVCCKNPMCSLGGVRCHGLCEGGSDSVSARHRAGYDADSSDR